MLTVDRRFSAQHVSTSNLNYAQRSTFDDLADEGYGLLFIRSTTAGKVAVCSSGNQLVTIDQAGSLNLQPSIDLRR
ncbi:hypothetical protein [Echinimonas agarilytica]|uniref:Uncharacterized protein n=1 Tax=Echinimonas agarilytica TaxID=1215918 RepID=A0AA41W565_9GAMM|nr:hypothetical protein [Echinimonas agarilytica]MCM2678538.1 hypothetical protein [Echinimonas agarilytica]